LPLLSLAKTPSALEPLTISPRARILPGSMVRLLVALLPTLFSAMRSRRHLVIENLALRQQLATLAGRRHPDIRPADRVFWVLLRRHHDSYRCLGRPAASRDFSLRVGAALSDLRSRCHLLGRADGHDPVDAHGANAHQLPEPLAKWGRVEVCRSRPPRASRPRHRPQRAPPAAADRVGRHLLQRRWDAHRGRPGRNPQVIQISPPPASAEGDRVPAGRWCRPFTRLAPRSRPRFRRQHPAPPRFRRRSVHGSCFGEPPA
jgi:hypothetical protein